MGNFLNLEVGLHFQLPAHPLKLAKLFECLQEAILMQHLEIQILSCLPFLSILINKAVGLLKL